MISYAAVLRVLVGSKSGTVKVKVSCDKHIERYLTAAGISYTVSN